MTLLQEYPPPAAEVDTNPASPEQGVIEEARRRQRKRVGAVAGGLVALVGIAGLAWMGLGGGSRAQSPRAHGRARALAVQHAGAPTPVFNVRLSPVLTGGQTGWCTVSSEGGSCAGTPSTASPFFGGVEESYGAKSHYDITTVLTTPQVAAVLVNGRRVASVSLPGLPYGLRAARVVTRASPGPREDGRARARRHIIERPQPLVLVALDAHGRRIPSNEPSKAQSPSTSLAWQRPAAPAAGVCQLRATGLGGLAAQWGHVASRVLPYPGQIIGRAFTSCVDTEYYLNKWPMDAAILLDAAHPGTRPAAIPGLIAVPGTRGFFNGPGGFQGELTATRVKNAWLVVAGGSGERQRLLVLRHLRVEFNGRAL